MRNTACIWCLPLQHSSSYSSFLCVRKKATESLKCQTKLLSYWLQLITISETIQEGEIKILIPLSFITSSWLWALILHKLLDSLWSARDTVLETWAYCAPMLSGWATDWELKPQNSKLYFYLTLVGKESQGFGQKYSLFFHLAIATYF